MLQEHSFLVRDGGGRQCGSPAGPPRGAHCTQCFDSVVDAVSSHLAAPSDGQAAVLPDQIRGCGNPWPNPFAMLTDISSPAACHPHGRAPDPHQDRSPQLATLRQHCSTLSGTAGCGACLSQVDDTTKILLGKGRSLLAFQACRLSVLLYVVASYPDGIRFPGAVPCPLDLPNLNSEPPTSGSAMIVEHAAEGAAVMLTLFSLLCAIALAVRRCIRNRRSSRRMAMAAAAAGTKLDRLLLDGGWDASSAAAPLFTFTLAEIRTATDNFAEERVVGAGRFGCVYRGVLPDGRRVAVKRITDTTGHADAQFANEAHAVSSVRHRNLVVLLGWCVAQEVEHGQLHHERLLVHDYMENGSLADFMSDPSRNALTWEDRKKIVIGVARGICYLHRGVKPAIIHRDIKPSNILLDGQLCPRLADFGLAKVNKEGVTHLTTNVAGTFGYVAPEYAMYGQLTERSDVYSFGVVVLELITGLNVLVSKSAAAARVGSSFCPCFMPPCLLPDWAWAVLKEQSNDKGGTQNLIDPRICSTLCPNELVEIHRFMHVALLCSHPHPSNRVASMHEALKMLEGDTVVPKKLPNRPLPLNSTSFDVELINEMKHSAAET